MLVLIYILHQQQWHLLSSFLNESLSTILTSLSNNSRSWPQHSYKVLCPIKPSCVLRPVSLQAILCAHTSFILTSLWHAVSLAHVEWRPALQGVHSLSCSCLLKSGTSSCILWTSRQMIYYKGWFIQQSVSEQHGCNIISDIKSTSQAEVEHDRWYSLGTGCKTARKHHAIILHHFFTQSTCFKKKCYSTFLKDICTCFCIFMCGYYWLIAF